MDPRGAAAITDAAGAVEGLSTAGGQHTALLSARAKTREELEALRARVDVERLPRRSALVMFGSWGRHELTGESDDDWSLLVEDPDLDLEGPSVRDALGHLREVFKEEKAPGRQAYFGCAFHAWPLWERIGLDEDDTRNLTRRMLLLLESVAVTQPETLRGVQDEVLGRYLEYHRRSFKPPRFLLNDIIRYWRTVCVDFEGKTAQDRRQRADKDKFVMRNAKLRTSRKMLFASGLLPVLLCRFVEDSSIGPFLRSQLDALATDRVARAFLHLGQRDSGARTLAAYGAWVELVGDAQTREALDGMQKAERRESPIFADVERIGEQLDNGLTGLLFESSLAEIAQTYTVF